jgi:hypothetical protein
MSRLALGGTCGLAITPRHFSGSAALVDAISDERAKAPTPRHVCPRNVRRCRRRMGWRLEFILIVGWCGGMFFFHFSISTIYFLNSSRVLADASFKSLTLASSASLAAFVAATSFSCKVSLAVYSLYHNTPNVIVVVMKSIRTNTCSTRNVLMLLLYMCISVS